MNRYYAACLVALTLSVPATSLASGGGSFRCAGIHVALEDGPLSPAQGAALERAVGVMVAAKGLTQASREAAQLTLRLSATRKLVPVPFDYTKKTSLFTLTARLSSWHSYDESRTLKDEPWTPNSLETFVADVAKSLVAPALRKLSHGVLIESSAHGRLVLRGPAQLTRRINGKPLPLTIGCLPDGALLTGTVEFRHARTTEVTPLPRTTIARATVREATVRVEPPAAAPEPSALPPGVDPQGHQGEPPPTRKVTWLVGGAIAIAIGSVVLFGLIRRRRANRDPGQRRAPNNREPELLSESAIPDLTGVEFKALCLAMKSAFPSEADLRGMLRQELNLRLDDFTSGALDERVHRLVEWAEARGRVEELVAGARIANDGNAALKHFADRYLSSIQRSVAQRERRPELEKIVRSNLAFKDISAWRARLERIERQVCVVEIAGHPAGTGFLVAKDLVLTNHHVVRSQLQESKPKVVARFDYRVLPNAEISDKGIAHAVSGSDWLVASSPHSPVDTTPPNEREREPSRDELDFALIRLEVAAGEESVEEEARGWVELPNDEPLIEPDSPLLIPQHPHGKPMQLAFDTQSIIAVNEQKTRVRYRTNTDPGSSGSPCFDANWELIALHHSGEPGVIDATYNEGIPIYTIANALAQDVREELGWL